MSWSSTYSHALAIAVDMLGSALAWSNTTADVTISSMCGLELRKETINAATRAPPQAPHYAISKRLVKLGRLLNRIDENHCEKALAADLARLSTARDLLCSVPNPRPVL